MSYQFLTLRESLSFIIAFVRKHLFTELDISSITPGVPGEHQPGSVSDCVVQALPPRRHSPTRPQNLA